MGRSRLSNGISLFSFFGIYCEGTEWEDVFLSGGHMLELRTVESPPHWKTVAATQYPRVGVIRNTILDRQVTAASTSEVHAKHIGYIFNM